MSRLRNAGLCVYSLRFCHCPQQLEKSRCQVAGSLWSVFLLLRLRATVRAPALCCALWLGYFSCSQRLLPGRVRCFHLTGKETEAQGLLGQGRTVSKVLRGLQQVSGPQVHSLSAPCPYRHVRVSCGSFRAGQSVCKAVFFCPCWACVRTVGSQALPDSRAGVQ